MERKEKKEELTILWTNADPIAAEMMVFMYAEKSIEKGWWDKVTLIIWGSTAKLVATNKDIQKKLLKIKETGVTVSCCLSCATKLGVKEDIEKLGIDLRYWGAPLTELIKKDAKLITL